MPPLVGAGLLTAGCPGDPPPLSRLVVAAPGPDSGYHAVAAAYAAAARKRWRIDTEVLPTSGAVESLTLVADGRATVAFASADTVAVARGGEAPFRNALTVAILANLYEEVLQIVVRTDSRIRELRDLRGRRVSTGPVGSVAHLVALRVFGVAGLHPERDIVPSRLPLRASAGALVAGEIDAFVGTAEVPAPDLVALAERVPISLVPVAGAATAVPDSYGGYYAARSVPARTYGQNPDAATLGIANVLVVVAQLPERAAYRLTELLFVAKADLVAAQPAASRIDPRTALATGTLPLHAGARRYYREAKPFG